MAYTYLVGWTKENKFYYGARWAAGCKPEDLWTRYFTSSKHVAEFRKLHGDPDVIQVRKLFEDDKACRSYERKVLERLNVLHNDKWLNKNINGKFLPTGPQTAEHIHNRVAAFKASGKHKGITPWTKESHPLAAAKLSASLKGKKKSSEHVAAMRLRPQDTMQLTCPQCGKQGDYKNMKRWHMDKCRA